MSESTSEGGWARALARAAAGLSRSRSSTSRELVVVQREDWRSFAMKVTLSCLSGAVLYFVTKELVKMMDPTRREDEQNVNKSAIMKRIVDLRGKQVLQRIGKLNAYELRLFGDLVFPDQISTDFEDIGGLLDQKKLIRETVLKPLMDSCEGKEESGSKLFSAPSGVLLYGPPGTGKTMIAKAIAKGSGAVFLNIKASSVQDKWYGESTKIARAIFSLAIKLAPAIIFIDEIDSFLRERGGLTDHEVSSALKAEFLALWDGLLSDSPDYQNGSVLILGATNRPSDIDEAFLRRLSRRFKFDLPSLSDRIEILKAILSKESDCKVDVDEIAQKTEGYSGSDLRELCRMGTMIAEQDAVSGSTPRVLRTTHVIRALEHIVPASKFKQQNRSRETTLRVTL